MTVFHINNNNNFGIFRENNLYLMTSYSINYEEENFVKRKCEFKINVPSNLSFMIRSI